MQGLRLHDKMHGPEKLELLQHILKWKEKENFEHKFTGFFWQKKTIATASLYMQSESLFSFTDIIKVMIPQMISCTKTNTMIFAQIVMGCDSQDDAI